MPLHNSEPLGALARAIFHEVSYKDLLVNCYNKMPFPEAAEGVIKMQHL